MALVHDLTHGGNHRRRPLLLPFLNYRVEYLIMTSHFSRRWLAVTISAGLSLAGLANVARATDIQQLVWTSIRHDRFIISYRRHSGSRQYDAPSGV